MTGQMLQEMVGIISQVCESMVQGIVTELCFLKMEYETCFMLEDGISLKVCYCGW